MSVFVKIGQMATCPWSRSVCPGEGAISHTEHYQWLVDKDNVRMSISVNVSYCCAF